LQAVRDSVLDPKLTFLLMKVGSTRVGISVFRSAGAGAVLMQDRILEHPFTIRI
jgi:hypothetical protein